MDEESTLALGPPALPEFSRLLDAGPRARLEVLPNGRECYLSGDPEGFAASCRPVPPALPPAAGSLLLCARLLRHFGCATDEEQVVECAVRHGHLEASADPSLPGAIFLGSLAQLLDDLGLPAHVESGFSLEDLAQAFESGAGVLLAANAGELFDAPERFETGEVNCLALLTGVARDTLTQEVIGLFVNGAAEDEWSSFVPAEAGRRAWAETGGWQVVTDLVAP